MKHHPKKVVDYCYMRYYKATSREAQLWWLNRFGDAMNELYPPQPKKGES